ncbi:MAG TPA: hypothetical protein VFR74_12325 [Jiangellales bacterium]|nr:hypothetical protein [Jiangellales bacterium]
MAITTRLTGAELRTVVEAAHRAPSVLNTQPWRWAEVEDGLELRADSVRVLRVADPLGRFLVVSCGASLLNARLALRHLGREPVVRLGPDPDEPRLLARIRVVPGQPATQEEDWLYAAIPNRRTNRGPFHERKLGSRLIRRLIDAAAAEGAVLTLLDPTQAARVLEIADEAAAQIADDQRRTAELGTWVHPDRAPDGIAVSALGPEPADGGHAVRDFDPEHRLPPRDTASYEKEPTVAVLSTYGDSRTDWLRAGEALQRVLLVATLEDVQASFRNEPLEILEYRWRVRDATTGVGHPQMVMRLGYGAPVGPSPRRPVGEVLDT